MTEFESQYYPLVLREVKPLPVIAWSHLISTFQGVVTDLQVPFLADTDLECLLLKISDTPKNTLRGPTEVLSYSILLDKSR
jgi:hypothetical protein